MSDEAFVVTLEAFRRHAVRDRLGEIAVPTLVIGGDEDAMIPPSYVRDIADGIPGAELVILEGHAHQPFHEIPDEYNALMTGFWDRVTD
jgi:pimeloyl-ACP methyl ester carboxylesterase